jgi:competence protein ComGC
LEIPISGVLLVRQKWKKHLRLKGAEMRAFGDRLRRHEKGLTWVELVIAIGILGIMATVTVPDITVQRSTAIIQMPLSLISAPRQPVDSYSMPIDSNAAAISTSEQVIEPAQNEFSEVTQNASENRPAILVLNFVLLSGLLCAGIAALGFCLISHRIFKYRKYRL